MIRSPCKLDAKLGHHLSPNFLVYELLIMARVLRTASNLSVLLGSLHTTSELGGKKANHSPSSCHLLSLSLSFSFLFRVLVYRFRSQGKLCGYQRRRCQLHFRRTGHDYIRQKKQQKMVFLSERKTIFEPLEKRPGRIN